MIGYDREKARAFILSRVDRRLYRDLEDDLPMLIADAIDMDIAYMKRSGVLSEDGHQGDAFYDEDDAFEAIVDAMLEKRGFDADRMLRVASLLSDYMEAQAAFLEQEGLVE